MSVMSALQPLRRPFVALAVCALFAQQLVGFALTASPAMAIEAGFSLCLSGPPPASDDPLDSVSGAGFCPCTLQSISAILPHGQATLRHLISASDALWIGPPTAVQVGPTTGPPPARAPPARLHTA